MIIINLMCSFIDMIVDEEAHNSYIPTTAYLFNNICSIGNGIAASIRIMSYQKCYYNSLNVATPLFSGCCCTNVNTSIA